MLQAHTVKFHEMALRLLRGVLNAWEEWLTVEQKKL